MTKFLDLLKPVLLDPGKQQEYAKQQFPYLVKESKYLKWRDNNRLSNCMLIIVAHWSQYDLAMLDIIEETLTSESIPVYLTLAGLEDLDEIQPKMPVVSFYEDKNIPEKKAWGKNGRDLIAEILGLDPEEFNQEVISRVERK